MTKKQLMFEPNFTLIKIICEAETSKQGRDELFTSVVDVFMHNELMIPLLNQQFRREIQQTSIKDSSTLFRAESAAIKLMSKYFMVEGKQYLMHFVRPLVHKIIQRGSLEVNASKIEKGECVQKNAMKLIEIAQEFLDQLCSNLRKCPV
eukprot:TRINITY_DN13721_c0_g1_i1.p1 TRINITY_DN13721_c0_g1~~TRINITY_DN13721_c0_g1_i1.p1  ORF type:complete len:149 (+),score=20.55 TRINITY_DN13721_c0_g1_i1:207-653(+)